MKTPCERARQREREAKSGEQIKMAQVELRLSVRGKEIVIFSSIMGFLCSTDIRSYRYFYYCDTQRYALGAFPDVIITYIAGKHFLLLLLCLCCKATVVITYLFTVRCALCCTSFFCSLSIALISTRMRFIACQTFRQMI